MDTALEKVGEYDFLVFHVVDDDGICSGYVTEERHKANMAKAKAQLAVKIIGEPIADIFPDNSDSSTIVKMTEAKGIKLFVVQRKGRNKLIGMLTMSDIIGIGIRQPGKPIFCRIE